MALKNVFLVLLSACFPIAAAAQTVSTSTAGTAGEQEIKSLKDQYDKVSYSNKISDENLKAALSGIDSVLQKIMLENRLNSEKGKQEAYDLSNKLDKLKAEDDFKAEQIRAASLDYTKEKSDIEIQIKRMELAEKKAVSANTILKARLDKLKTELDLRDRKEDWKKQTNTDPVYSKNPFDEKSGELIISDRRISLNGPILEKTADYVTDRIQYFNNISDYPIFIVIDTSPGGSVMSGYRILKAMESSKSPVYVVVKSYAASMAAVITTLAEKSFVYPNAIILHHQMSSMSWGNMTQMKEQLELARQWEKRLDTPVVKKMGITMDEFRKEMYEKNSDGDWQEFGDNAVKYKWADYVVNRIDETGVVKNPDYSDGTKKNFYSNEKTDENGNRYLSLPRLEPFDFYFIYNPDRYYR